MLALDYETFYGPGYSVKDMGYYAYTHDPRFDCYLVAVCDGQSSTACHPSQFDWSRVEGQTLIAHNAAFDMAVFDRLQALGVIPKPIRPKEWLCTSAMSAYLQCPRDLAGAAKALLDIEVSKDVRKRMSGQRHHPSLFPDDVLQYARTDAEVCFKLWDKFNHLWPEHERRLWRLTVAMGQRGIALDLPHLDAAINQVKSIHDSATLSIPWSKTSPPTSTKALKGACAAISIPPPPSTSDDDPELDKWIARYISTTAPLWVRHMQTYRRANRTLCVLQAMRSRLMPGGRMESHLLYFGANTGRWSGGNHGLNLQNLNSKDACGIDLRRCLVVAAGHRFIVADLSQIEPRVLAYASGDAALLAKLAAGMDLYEAHARATMGYNDPRPLKVVDKALRQLAKARVLGLGYGCGPNKFITVAKVLGGLDLSFDQARATVHDYRRSNPSITAFWNRCERAFIARDGQCYRMPLPSGRRLCYWDVNAGDMTAAPVKGGRRANWWGGKLVENFVQAVARDIFAEALLRLHAAGLNPVLTVHDEVVLEVPDTNPISPSEVERMMSIAPDWMPGLPLAAEAFEAKEYRK